jgi:hypothetical protein
MSLLDELKEQRSQAVSALEMQQAYVVAHQSNVDDWHVRIGDIDRAIAALEPAPYGATSEQVAAFKARYSGFQADPIPDEPELFEDAAVAREQLETDHALPPSADDVVVDDWCPEYASAERFAIDETMQDEPGDTSEFAEPDDEAKRAAAIELTADVEPEIQALIESGEHSYDEVAAIAYPEPQWNEPQTEGYAPVVTPEAKMFSHGIQSEQKPDPRDWPFSHLFTGKPKVDA